MSLVTAYDVGRVSVLSGSTSVTGVGTAWAGAAIREGDKFWLGGFIVRISEYIDNENIILARPWPGEDSSDSVYEIHYTPDSERVLNYSMQVLRAMNVNALSNLATLTPVADQMVHYTGLNQAELNTITPVARELLSKGTVAEMLDFLGVGG